MDLPTLALPATEARYLEERLGQSRTYLEYGSGGSTVLAARLGVDRIMSVESDRFWLQNIARSVAEHFPATQLIAHWVDVGPTGQWGMPVDPSSCPLWPNYASDIWCRDDFRHPDLVLIDGRFRVACFLAASALCERPLSILFDDYGDRPNYHICEALVPVSLMVGRMAVFEVEPGIVAASAILQNLRYFFDAA